MVSLVVFMAVGYKWRQDPLRAIQVIGPKRGS